MDKTNKRVSKRHLTLPALAILLAVFATGSSGHEEERIEKVVDIKTVAYNPLLDKAIQEYKNDLEEKWIEEQRKMEEEAERARKKAEAVKAAALEEEKKSYSDEDLYWLSRVVSSEAKGESKKGQIAVANVVLNRVNSGKFKDTIKGVVLQKKQFSGVYDKSIFKEPTEEAIESAKKALEGERVIDEDVYYFYNPKTATSRWLDTRKKAVDIGNHRFTY